MTWVYMTRADGQWARFWFDFADDDERTVWDFLADEHPALYDALPMDAEFVVGESGLGFHPGLFETFGRMEDLVAWIGEAVA